MRFDPNDIKTMSNTMSLGWWIRADGAEALYASACGGERGTANPSAVAALEVYLNRKGYLWAEDTKTATRLHVGAEFTWKGERVKVTSFSGDYLVAVTSGERRDDVGYHHRERRMVEMSKTLDDGTIIARYSPPVDPVKKGSIHIHKVTHEELTKVRKAYDAKRKSYEKEYVEAVTMEVVEDISLRIATEGRAAFRHFDVDILKTARQTATARIKDKMTREEQIRWNEKVDKATADDLARWMAGENVHRSFNVVRLRIAGDWVETSTMQRATVKEVRRAIAWGASRRAGWKAGTEQFDLDNYPVKCITPEGCQVGCTFVPWSEIDRIATQLADTANA